jgi:hypothetical protein
MAGVSSAWNIGQTIARALTVDLAGVSSAIDISESAIHSLAANIAGVSSAANIQGALTVPAKPIRVFTAGGTQFIFKAKHKP